MIEYDIAILEEIKKELEDNHIDVVWGQGIGHNKLYVHRVHNSSDIVYIGYNFMTANIEVILSSYDHKAGEYPNNYQNIYPEYNRIPFGRIMWSFELAHEDSISSAVNVIKQIIKLKKVSIFGRINKLFDKLEESINSFLISWKQ